jgi:hypothetical protein
MKMDKKARERLLITEVSTLYYGFPKGTIIDHESPDFLVRQDNHIYGMEIGDYVRGQTAGGSINRRKESVWQEIANQAQVEFELKSNIKIWTSFSWYPHRLPRQKDVAVLAERVATLLASHVLPAPSTWIRIGEEEFENTPLEEFLHAMYVSRVKERSSWSFGEGGFTEVQVAEIEWLISSKDRKVDQYLRDCDSVWLIIVADGLRISSFSDLTQRVIEQTYGARFERVLFYDRLRKKVLSLSISH